MAIQHLNGQLRPAEKRWDQSYAGTDQSSYTEMSDQELEKHIADCGAHMEVAYERFQETGCPHDRDEAVMWMHREMEAIAARRPGQIVLLEMTRDLQ